MTFRQSQSPATGISIRPWEVSDIATLVAIEQASCPHPWSTQVWQGEIQNPHSKCLVAQTDGAEIIGYCLYWVVGDEIEIQNIAVMPAYRCCGVGQQLLGTVVQNTHQRVLLEVRKSNTAARLLYEKAGFTIDAIRPRYYPDGDDAILMSLR